MGCGSFKSGKTSSTSVYDPLDSNNYPETAELPALFALLQPPPSPASEQRQRFPGQLLPITEESELQRSPHSAIPTY